MPAAIIPPDHHDDHVKTWRLIKAAKSAMWPPARFANEQCRAWGVELSAMYPRNGGSDICLLRYILINRLKAAYPGLSSNQIGRIVKKSHTTVLFTLGELTWRKPTPMLVREQSF